MGKYDKYNNCDNVLLPKISQATKSKFYGDSMLNRARKLHTSEDLRSRGKI